MREPAFWRRRSLTSLLLMPLAALYGTIAARRMAKPGLSLPVPVICVGNYHGGGAGKTPTTLALVDLLHSLDETPVVLSRGYGGRLQGPVVVDPARHSADEVGDEPLMMARRATVVVAKDRAAGAALALARRASVLVMDDGFQNPALAKDVSLIVIDAGRGIGNGRVIPSGPLRAPLAAQVARTDALLIIGEGGAADAVAAAVAARAAPVHRARFAPDSATVEALRGRRVLAFAGIGDPERFFATLETAGIAIGDRRAFPDHHPFTADDIAALADQAQRQGLVPLTTEKDLARLGAAPQLIAAGLAAFPVTLQWDDAAGFRRLVIERLGGARDRLFAGNRR